MIKINRPATAPDVLRVQGARRRNTHIRTHAQGQREFSFDAKIYGHATVKAKLIEGQHGKCCFCEEVVGERGDVEHFRPKAGVRQSANEPMQTPGYYWLAYDWDNLFLACHICNQRYKQNLFPLVDPANRARTHQDDIAREQPLLIDPSLVDPQDHISFREEVPYAVNGSALGETTIEVLGLRNQATLTEQRRSHLAVLQSYQHVVNLEADLKRTAEGRHLVKIARDFLRKAVLDNAPFASMARAGAGNGFRSPIL